MNTKKGFAGIAVMIFILIAVGGAYFYIQEREVGLKNQDEARAEINSTTEPTASQKIEESAGLDVITEVAEKQAPILKSQAPKPDLIIEDIEIYALPSGVPEQGQRVSAKICNVGDVGFNAGEISGEPDKISISLTINGITGNSDKTIEVVGAHKCEFAEAFPFMYVDTYHGPWRGMKSGTYPVKALVSTDVEESNKSNNSFTKDIYFNFDRLGDKITVTSPTVGTVWRENGQYTIRWSALSPKVVRYYVVIGNSGSRTSKGETSSYSQEGIGNQTTLDFTIPTGFVESMFMGDSKGKTVSDIKNDFYIDIIATDSNGDRIGTGSSQTFTIDPD